MVDAQSHLEIKRGPASIPLWVKLVYTGFLCVRLDEEKPQEWMPPLVYLGVLLIGLPVCVYLPTHVLLRLCFRPSGGTQPGGGESLPPENVREGVAPSLPGRPN